ncbi:MAG: phosphotransferase [Flavobacteriaceae bacterium]|nr:fructosamine kinase family protein [Bacteroidia bacterium]NNF81517.1 phosphotransferase [Flavobacteriaceae bacterium]NNK70182.1 phosphotransferase [Flavobacteriaceae bacterium]NNL81202.1 phosphotransferase [Flavobacteriaceae bacterium]
MSVRDVIFSIASSNGLNLENYIAVSGGDISRAYLLHTSDGNFFLKLNSDHVSEDMFNVEAKGLQILAAAKAIKIPDVIGHGRIGDYAYLLLEAIKIKNETPSDLETLGEQLAQLHLSTAEQFGLDHSNFIGSLHQSNDFHEDWTTFYIAERLWPQYQLALSKGLLTNTDIPYVEQMTVCCDNLFEDIKPSLLHGDLWSGNYLIDQQGLPVLIDPAVYYGHHEVDIAMSRLFGGFSSDFYSAYEYHFPVTEGYEDRMDLYQLYYLLVHLNLFGGSYYGSVMRLTKRLFSL